jgi:hypothetical protein
MLSGPKHQGLTTMADSVWQTLLKSVLETEEIEIDCQDCYELLDSYAELLLAGNDPVDLMPAVKQHLKQCNCCHHELEALIIMLQEVAGQDTSSPAN